MLSFWHSDNHTRSYKWWLQKCHWWDQWKHISDGDNDGGWRFGSSLKRSPQHPGHWRWGLHTNDETSLLLRAAPHCCCCCCKNIVVVVVPPGLMSTSINIHLMWSWKLLVKTKKDERRRLRTLMRKLLLLLVLNVYKKYEVHFSVNF